MTCRPSSCQWCSGMFTQSQLAPVQEWASQNEIVVPHRENRPNAAMLYKFEEDQHPTNILQARCLGNAPA